MQPQNAQRSPSRAPSQAQARAAPATIIVVEQNPPDFVLWSFFNTLFLNSFCFGFIALIYSIKARDCKVIRDLEGANRFGKIAKVINIVAFVIGFVTFVVTVVLAAMMAKGATRRWLDLESSVAKLRVYHPYN